MKVSEIKKIIEKAFLYSPPLPILITGRAGIGKSQVIKKAFSDIKIVDIRSVNYDIGDLVTKVPKEGSLKSFYTEWLLELAETKEKTILLLDEFDKATPAIQRLFYQIILDREVEGVKLSDSVLIIAVQNTEDDGSFSSIEQEKPLYDRFVFRINVEPDLNQWTDWALSNNIDNRIVAFLNRFPKNFYLETEDRLIATPRRWEFLSNLIRGVEDTKEIEFYTSTVISPEIGVMFKKFIEVSKKFDIPSIVQGRAKIPEKIDEQYSLIPGLVEYVVDNENYLRQFLVRLKEEMEIEAVVVFMRTLITMYATKKGIEREEAKNKLSQFKEFSEIVKYIASNM